LRLGLTGAIFDLGSMDALPSVSRRENLCCKGRCRCLSRSIQSVECPSAENWLGAWEWNGEPPIAVWHKFLCQWASAEVSIDEPRTGVELVKGEPAMTGGKLPEQIARL